MALVLLAVFLVWTGVGATFGFFIDRMEMKEHVPFGDLPACFTLPTIRAIVILESMLIGFPFAVWLLALRVRLEYRRARFEAIYSRMSVQQRLIFMDALRQYPESRQRLGELLNLRQLELEGEVFILKETDPHELSEVP
jgi:hypothetical protein